jgi:hypothetical protein
LLQAPPSYRYPLDVKAVIVPTARNASMMKPAVRLAAKLNSTLVVLSSKWSEANAVAGMVRNTGAKLVAVDVNEIPTGVLPNFQTCKLLSGTKLERRTDTSAKRNLGLLLANLIGWERVVFLDDDITVPEPLDLRDAAGLTDNYAGVGLAIGGYPDNSVVCHAYREAGGGQDMFVGGGALAIGSKSLNSFFPNIYNEDWFFLLGDDGLQPTTATGTAVQKTYDPFATDVRARREEFGDCLAEGLFWLLDTGKSLKDATVEHWRWFLRERAEFITEVIAMVGDRIKDDPAKRARMLISLKAARGRCQSIDPGLCVKYVNAWQRDRKLWRDHVAKLHGTHGLEKREKQDVDEVREMFRALGFADENVHLILSRESLD